MTRKTPAKFTAVPVDLASLDTITASDKGTEIELVHPITADKLGIFVGILGKHSEAFREHVAHETDTRIRRDMFARKRGKDVPAPTMREVEGKSIDLLVVCTTGWRTETYNEAGEVVTNEPTIYYKGDHLNFTEMNAKLIYENLIWAREQVDAGIGDLANFIKS